MSSKSKSSSSSSTTNVDKRVANEEGGVVLQSEGNSSIIFEDLSEEVVEGALKLAGTFITEAGGIFDKAIKTTDTALGNTQTLAQNLFEEKNTPSSDNIRNIVYALTAGVSLAAIAYIWRNK